MLFRYIAAFLTALAVTTLVGLVLIPYLRRKKAGQKILEIGPAWHRKKEGTPTMGGLMFIAGIAAALLAVGYPELRQGEYSHLFVFIFALFYAAIGFLDDYEKLLKKQNLGLTAGQKFILQLVVAIVFVLLLRLTGHLTPNLYVPFFNVTLPVSEPVYLVLAALIIVGTVNSVNLTDGADGLAAGVTLPVGACFCAVAALWGRTPIAILSAALCGALVGFLFFNFYPARVFMGDTGSLFLGGMVCALAFALDAPLILVPLCLVYIAETLSDIIQVSYFKLTKGKRVFKMAPLHHHFEMSGWSEVKLFFVFSGVSLLCAVISYLAVAGRYGV